MHTLIGSGVTKFIDRSILNTAHRDLSRDLWRIFSIGSVK